MKRIAGLFVAFAAASMIASCSGGGGGNDTTPIAMVGPMTGQYASFGAQMKAGADMAVADINAAGGVLGKKLALDDRRRRLRPEAGGGGRQPVGRQRGRARRRPFLLGLVDPGLAVYAEADIVQISPASTNPKFTDERAGPNIYRVCGRDDQQGGVAGKYLAEKFKDKNIAIVHDKTAYGKGLADEIKKAMNAAGKKEVMYEADHRRREGLLGAGLQAQAGQHRRGLFRRLPHRGRPDRAPDARPGHEDDADRRRRAGHPGVLVDHRRAGEGTLMTFSPDPRKIPAAAEVVARFKAKGIDPEGYVLYTYAAVQAWKQAAEKAKSVAAEVVKALNDTEFDTVIGKFKFNEKGDPNLPPYAVYRWSNGGYEEINEQADPIDWAPGPALVLLGRALPT